MELFTGIPTATFQPSKPFLINADRLVIDMEIAASAAGEIDWYLEFASGDPNDLTTKWFREVAEEDIGGGVTHMPAVVRDYLLAGAGTQLFSAQFVRTHHYTRVQFKQSIAAGISNLVISAPFGLVAASVS